MDCLSKTGFVAFVENVDCHKSTKSTFSTLFICSAIDWFTVFSPVPVGLVGFVVENVDFVGSKSTFSTGSMRVYGRLRVMFANLLKFHYLYPIMAVIQTTVHVRNNAAKKRLKEIAKEKELKLQEERKKFSAISSIVKKKSRLSKKKRTK